MITTTIMQNKKEKVKELKEKWSEKQMHRQFIRGTTEKVDKQNTW